MSKRFVLILSTILVFTKSFTQNTSRNYDAYIAATFDLLNNKTFIPLQLEDTAGHLFNTSTLLGKTIYVDFWFTACPPCLKEIPFYKRLQQQFKNDTNTVFLSICIENIDQKASWKKMVKEKEIGGIHLFYARNRPQKVNLLRRYDIVFPTYLLVNKEMKIIGYDAPRPSEKGWVEWALSKAGQGTSLSASYKEM